MASLTRQRFRLSGGPELALATAGDSSNPAVLLIHGYPSSAQTFRDVVPALSEAAYVIAPDLPGYGESDLLPEPSFSGIGGRAAGGPRASRGWTAPHLPSRLGHPRRIPRRHGGPGAGPRSDHPERQRASHRLRPHLGGDFGLWADPTPENEKKAFSFFTLEATRDQYLGGVPPEVAERISPQSWEEDWRVMNPPRHKDLQRDLLRDYGRCVARFNEIDEYLAQHQPPALLIWGRHDIFFDIAEVLSWMAHSRRWKPTSSTPATSHSRRTRRRPHR